MYILHGAAGPQCPTGELCRRPFSRLAIPAVYQELYVCLSKSSAGRTLSTLTEAP